MAQQIPNASKYKKQGLLGGWTRIEILLQLYDRAIISVTGAEQALENNDQPMYTRMFIDAQKTILAIHSGLKPDEHDIAFNIARLLHFVLTCIEQKQFSIAAKTLQELRDGFAAIAEEATELERNGTITPMENVSEYSTVV